MSLQWTLITSFLYTEIALVLLLVVPVPNAKRWQGVLRSRFLNLLRRQSSWYFGVAFFVLMLFLLDSIREIRKYSSSESGNTAHAHAQQLDLEIQGSMRLFRAQRNFYISGFALFLIFVIRRLFIILTAFAAMEAQSHAALRQAAGATLAAKDLISSAGISPENLSHENPDKEVAELKTKLARLIKELEAERVDKEALREQAGTLNKEYDRLSEEYNMLVKKLRMQAAEDEKNE